MSFPLGAPRRARMTAATFAVPDDLVRDKSDADGGHHGEGEGGGDVGCDGKEGEQQEKGDRPPASESAADAQSEQDVRQEIERDAADEPERRDERQRCRGVVQRRLEPEGEQDDAADHGEVEVGVHVAGQRGATGAGCFGESGLGDVDDPVEVRPPQAGDDGDAQQHRRDEPRTELESRGADADGDD